MSTDRRKRILLQGATGSIGKSVLSVVREHAEDFAIVGLAAHSNVKDLLESAAEFRIQSVALADETKADSFYSKARENGIEKIYLDRDAVTRQTAELDYDLLVNAMMGSAGIESTLISLKRGIPVALANKETLVAAGPLVMQTAKEFGASVIPIDSEHSAIFQCLSGEKAESVRKLWLTSSGGPFIHKSKEDLASVTVEQALAHPTWKMGPKITIDSATLFNKGLEVIEAERLFGVAADQIHVVVHRQSIIHSMVEYCDGSIKAQLSTPDMRLPILFALSYPKRIKSDIVQTDICKLANLTFEEVPYEKFPALKLAYRALEKGGTAPAAISAADEIAVQAFLDGKIKYSSITKVLEGILEEWPDEPMDSLHTVQSADLKARKRATEKVSVLSSS
jgi:1-deoxy-D-xylulose-5-phosphate reductoisomerase